MLSAFNLMTWLGLFKVAMMCPNQIMLKELGLHKLQ